MAVVMEDTRTLMRDNYPIPTGWRLLVKLPPTSEKSKGGVFLPQQAQADQKHLAMVAQVITKGPLAYTREDQGDIEWCAEGDFIMFGKYAGTRFMVGDDELRLINDDEVQAIVPDPGALRFGV